MKIKEIQTGKWYRFYSNVPGHKIALIGLAHEIKHESVVFQKIIGTDGRPVSWLQTSTLDIFFNNVLREVSPDSPVFRTD